MAYTREQYEKEIRRISGDEGIPADMMVRLWKTESGGRDVNIGYHYPNDPKKTAYGPWGITAGFAKDFSPEGDPDSWKDPIGGIYTAARGLQSHYKRFGNWPQAIEGYKLGPENVGNLAFRKEHPNEWNDVAEIIEGTGAGARAPGGGPAGLYPSAFNPEMMTAAADRTRVASEGLMSAQGEYDQAAGQPFNLPRMPVLPQRSLAAVGFPSILANLATAISGNPLYQQQQMGQFANEDQERRQAQQANLELSRDEILETRRANLQNMQSKMMMAAQRLEAAEKYEDALKMQGEAAKVQEKIQKMEGDQAKERAEIAAGATTDAAYIRLQGVLAKQGWELSKDESGEWQVAHTGGAESNIKLKRGERMERVASWGKLFNDTKDPVKKKFMQRQMTMAIATPDDDDKQWNGFYGRIKRELRAAGLTDAGVELAAYVAAMENANKLPGAFEEYKTRWEALNPGKKFGVETAGVENIPDVEEPAPKERSFLDEMFGARSPEQEAARTKRREAMGQAIGGAGQAIGGAGKSVAGAVVGALKAGAAVGKIGREGIRQGAQAVTEATTMSAEEHASSNVESAQKQVDNLEGLMKRYPQVFSTPDTVAALADAYKQLAKAKKDLDIIKNKGESPKKP